MDIEELIMPIDEWNKQFSNKYMQQPISFLTEENLNKLEQHCEKTIQYGNGRILKEHQVTLELIIRYRELQQELEKEKEKNKKIEKELEKHIKFCEQEAEGSLNNEICHIALKFNKGLLDIINEEE